MDWFRKRKRKRPTKEDSILDQLETLAERRERWISIRIIYFTMFLMSLGFSIILTGVWPYLDKLDPTAGKEFMGLIVGANPLGQMIFSPLVGWWSNRLTSIHLPLLISVSIFTIASGWYSMLDLFVTYRKYWMLFTRFLIGISSANIAVCRSYLSAATTVHERTGAVSMVSLAQVLGFIVGPGLQAAVTPLGDKGYKLLSGYLTLNMYTAAGWINVALGILNFILFLPVVFKEHKIAAKEAMFRQEAVESEQTWKCKKPDYTSAWTLIAAFFCLVFNFVLLETLATSLTMDQFGWSKDQALYYMGILMSVGGVVACVTFVIIGPMCKIFDEYKVMLWGGFFFMVLGRVLYIPWGDTTPPIADYSSYINQSLLKDNGTDVDEPLGCPSTQEWCYYTPAMTITQLLVGYGFTSIGYPIGVTLIQTIFSKVLGPRPQGTWMGWMTGSGCFSRVLGPVFISYVYTRYGTIWTFGLTTFMMIVSLIWLYLMYPRITKAVDLQADYHGAVKGDKVNGESREMVVLVSQRQIEQN